MTDKQYGDLTINSIVNLWYDGVAPLAFSLLVVGLFLIWLHRRVCTSPVFGRLGELLVANGLVLLLFFRNPFPHPIILLLEVALWIGAATYATAIVTDFLLIRLPEWGVEEKALFEPEEHKIKPWIVPTLVFIQIVALWFGFPSVFRVEKQLLGDFIPWLILPMVLALMSLSAFRLLPYRRVRETALLGETAPPMELDNIFVVNGPASKMELIATPMMVLTIWAVVYFFTTGDKRGGTDWSGLLLLVFLGGSIARIEYLRWKKKERLEAASRAASVMTQEA